jgi:hypothetical protein
MKKYILLNLSVLFALFLAVCMFISCGKSKKSKPSEEGQRQPKASPSAKPLLSSREQKITKSINNQKQIGVGYVGYLGDNDGWFPRVAGPASVGGKQGDGMGGKGKLLPEQVARTYGAKVPVNERPLNKYVGDPRIFHDPADTGGGPYSVKSCWESFGNSYQPQVADDMFRVKRVLGAKSEPAESYEGTSMHESELIKPANKIIQGDWNWPYDLEDAWHAKEGEARHIMLYADMHVSEFVFPPTTQMKKWMLSPKPDPSFKWW